MVKSEIKRRSGVKRERIKKYLIRSKEDAILETSEHDDSADAANEKPILRIADKWVIDVH